MRLLRINLDLVFAAGFQVVFVWNYFVSSTAATCNDEQIHECRKSASKGELDKLSGGGLCQPKQYVQFTHVCTVSHYMPSVDYCCCEHAQRVMCCRYHQDWNTFRCSQGDDTVDTISKSGLPLKILLPVIIGPVLLLLCCVFCCVKCCCYRYDDDSDMLCCNSCEEKREKTKEKQAPADRSIPMPDDASMPLTYGMTQSASQPCPHCRHSFTDVNIKPLPYSGSCHHAIEPSAPPAEEGPDPYASPYATMCLHEKDGSVRPSMAVHAVMAAGNSAYARSQSDSSGSTGSSHYSTCGMPNVCRSHSCGAPVASMASDRPVCPTCQGPGNMAGHPSSGTCAPPSYDESQRHPVLPHMLAQQLNIHPEETIDEKC